MKKCKIVVGKNFGDEGKGLITAAFAKAARKDGRIVVVKHNGGAQAGHTVETQGIRMVFHQLGSGTVEGADTYLAESFLPDLMKLSEEIQEYQALVDSTYKKVYISSECKVTTIYDVILNSLAETIREKKHGSCGMGIFEATLRSRIMPLRIGDLNSFEDCYDSLRQIREQYVPKRLKEILSQCESTPKLEEWYELLEDDNVCYNAARLMYETLREYVHIVENDDHSVQSFFQGYNTVLFESGQGLLLDQGNMEYYPHLTPSKTGSYNAFTLLSRIGYSEENLDCEVCYVTRSYVTRHGNGRLDYECSALDIEDMQTDQTNVSNRWQSSLRFAKHGEVAEFLQPIEKDKINYLWQPKVSIAITHLNETHHKLYTIHGYIDPEEYVRGYQVYKSFSSDYLRF